MASADDQDEMPNFEVPWLTRWQQADFSWAGLASHQAWPRANSDTLQDYFRRLDREQSDEKLQDLGALVPCGLGLFHVVFIPDEWAEQIADIAAEDLLQRKRAYWAKIFESGGIRDHFRGTISGAHVPPEVEQKLTASMGNSFDWMRFNSDVINLPRRGDRSFTNSYFRERVRLHGDVKSEGGAARLHFTWCEFEGLFEASDFEGLQLLDLNASVFRSRLDFFNSSFDRLLVNDCTVPSLNMADSKFAGDLTIGGTKIGKLDWINCGFENNVLIVESHLEESVRLLGCDFRGRLTVSRATWPQFRYQCASAAGSKFDGSVVIEGANPPPVQLFEEAEFRSRVSLNSYTDKQKRLSFEEELSVSQPSLEGQFSKAQHAQNIESGARTLRKVAEAAGDVHSEHFWHRNELIARRSREETLNSERLFSFLYGFFADYGLSIAKPFKVLAVSTTIFALFYAWVGGAAWLGAVDIQSVWEGLGYSLNRTFPIGVFADESNSWRNEMLGQTGGLVGLAIRVVATAQTVLSAILIYLGVMAVRRKFRIS